MWILRLLAEGLRGCDLPAVGDRDRALGQIRHVQDESGPAPFKGQTIPRLELLSALLLARLVASVDQSLVGELQLLPPRRHALLDQGHRQKLETLRPELSERDQEVAATGLLEALFR